ncbi:MAG: type II toxin-antitoxin system PemK/MazF family toxin [Gemmatimonadota bacterium]
MIEARRGDVVLVAFPFVGEGGLGRKRRPAVVVQSDRYRSRAAVILAAITSSQKRRDLPCKVTVMRDSPQGRSAGLRTDSVVDCQTLITLPRSEVVARLGSFPPETLTLIDRALEDALALPGSAAAAEP